MLLSGKLICWEWNLKISLKLSEKIKRLFLFLLKAMPVIIGIILAVILFLSYLSEEKKIKEQYLKNIHKELLQVAASS